MNGSHQPVPATDDPETMDRDAAAWAASIPSEPQVNTASDTPAVPEIERRVPRYSSEERARA